MQAHVMGFPIALQCECGEKFIVAKWDKPPLQPYIDINFVAFAGELKCCPFCTGAGGIKAKEFA